jgi:uncharacterized membrane protein (TIGR02234 family)
MTTPVSGDARRTASRPTRRARQERAAAIGAVALGGLLMWVAAGRPWAAALLQQPPPLPDRRLSVNGSDLSGIVRAVALFSLAGVPALVALRGWGRAAMGLLLMLAGLAALTGLGLTSADRVRQSGAVATQVDTGAVVVVTGRTGWPFAYALGGCVVAAAGGLTLVRSRRWPGLGARYGPPSPGRGLPSKDGDPWTALDRGEDPTLRDGPAPPP